MSNNNLAYFVTMYFFKLKDKVILSYMSKLSYREELLTWGRNGTFNPSFIPSRVSHEHLKSVQYEITNRDLSSVILDNLHGTLFYCKPVRVFEYIRDKINPDVDEPYLYIDLMNALSTLSLLKTLPTPTRKVGIRTNPEIQPFGYGTTAAIELLPATDMFAGLKSLIRRGLAYHGVEGDSLDRMSMQPEFAWFVGETRPHISVAENTNISETIP